MKSRTINRITVPMVGLAICSAGIIGVGSASAASNPPKHQSAIHTPANPQAAETRYEARLAKAVTDGKLTSAQEQAILAEHKTLMAELLAATSTNRHQVDQQVRQEAAAWAKQNNLSVSWLLPGQVRHAYRPMAHHR